MSIASELDAMNDYIISAYSEIGTKGGTIPANKNMANLAPAISSISGGTSVETVDIKIVKGSDLRSGNLELLYLDPASLKLVTSTQSLAPGGSYSFTTIKDSIVYFSLYTGGGSEYNSTGPTPLYIGSVNTSVYCTFRASTSGTISFTAFCLLPGELVLMADGSSKRICDVLIGETVVAYCPERHVTSNVEVLRTYKHTFGGDIITLYDADGDKIISGTTEHPIFTSGGFKKLNEIAVSDALFASDLANVTIGKIEKTQYSGSVYNLDVDAPDTYFAGTKYQILCHNKPV